jgi:hypothetical protein
VDIFLSHPFLKNITFAEKFKNGANNGKIKDIKIPISSENTKIIAIKQNLQSLICLFLFCFYAEK